METMNTKDQADMNHWLKYWAVYGFLQVAEPLADGVVGFLPMYRIFKVSRWACVGCACSNDSSLIF